MAFIAQPGWRAYALGGSGQRLTRIRFWAAASIAAALIGIGSVHAADQQSPAPSIQELEAIQQQIDQGKIQASELNRQAEQLA